MTEENDKGDVLGLGKIAKSIPAQSWERLVATACDTFSDLLAPITAATSGVGRLVQAKFDKMVEVEKVLAADTVARAKAKVEQHKGTVDGNPKAVVLVNAMGSASWEEDEDLRAIWSNLIANEAVSSDVHPDFPRILSRLSKTDIVTLAQVTQASDERLHVRYMREFVRGVGFWGVSVAHLLDEDTEFSHEQLAMLNLIRKRSGRWELTRTGEAFVKSVSDPSFGETLTEQDDSGDA